MTKMAQFERDMDAAFRESVIQAVVQLHKKTVVLVYDLLIDQ